MKTMTDVLLRDLTWDDRNHFYNWINDERVVKYSLSVFQTIQTEKDIDDWFLKTMNNKENYNKAIIINHNIIGYAGISSINNINNSGELYIFIGEKKAWGLGIGTEVTKTIVEYGFKTLNLNRISLTVSSENIFAHKAYVNSGFIEEGRMRQACFRDNKYHDKILMSILMDEYNMLQK
jgi:RimJ/RimL family protein N-acetyltransferase